MIFSTMQWNRLAAASSDPQLAPSSDTDGRNSETSGSVYNIFGEVVRLRGANRTSSYRASNADFGSDLNLSETSDRRTDVSGGPPVSPSVYRPGIKPASHLTASRNFEDSSGHSLGRPGYFSGSRTGSSELYRSTEALSPPKPIGKIRLVPQHSFK